jgi:hypothetical protein
MYQRNFGRSWTPNVKSASSWATARPTRLIAYGTMTPEAFGKAGTNLYLTNYGQKEVQK